MKVALRCSPLLLIALVLALAIGTVLGASRPEPTACGQGAVSVLPAAQVGPGAPPAATVSGYSGAQLAGAAAIMRAGADHGVSVQGQTIGVMTAIGESSLTPVDHGDTAGPDSLGWFQQRDPWGPREVRLDAYGSATLFFTGGLGGQRGLLGVPGWETMSPTLAAHAVQVNADPWHYERFWAPATAIVAALGGGIAPAPGSGAVPCQDTALLAGGQPTAQGWTKPAVGPFTSGFGMRWGAPHNGVDIAPGAGAPVLAAADGVVVGVCTTNRSPCTGYGTLIVIDHGGGVITRSAHAWPQDVLVSVGQQVKAGQQIARVGTFGDSTGPHLHFEVQEGGRFVDPVPFLRARGVELLTAP